MIYMIYIYIYIYIYIILYHSKIIAIETTNRDMLYTLLTPIIKKNSI